MIYFKLKNKIYIDKYSIFIFTGIVIAVLFNLYQQSPQSFLIGRYIQSPEPLQSYMIQSYERVIQSRPEIFTTTPLQNTTDGSGFSFLPTPADFSGRPEFGHIYDILALHPSWFLNPALNWLLLVGQVNIVFAGILLGTTVYRNKELTQGLNAKLVLKKQVITAAIFALALIVMVSILGLALSYLRYHLQISHTPEMEMVRNIYSNIENLWRPGVLYYLRAVPGVFIYIFSGLIFGVFIGHLFKSRTIALLTFFFINNYSWLFLFLLPISPYYFLPRLINYFMFTNLGPLVLAGENFLISLGLLIFYLGLIIFASKKLLDWRHKKALADN